ncbi:hypothetical protein FNU76_04310 [Chitinimonas arctica]|uniref:Uncharacterized protein n=1 Tax=Chitinimonas arctica TaxID=2594795 RepID=A0A516SBW0_9NEIS|nr:hypothetical protein [Chitinimonas arctica]QDQ25639.1 hypothetical protein FNU76_04310 [Chitinimonas arctica]
MRSALALFDTCSMEVESSTGHSYEHRMVRGHQERVCGPKTNQLYGSAYQYGSFGDIQQAAIIIVEKALKLEAARERWQRLVMNPEAATDVDSLTETVEAGLEFIAEFGPQKLVLTTLTSQCVQAEHLAALLRATSTWSCEVIGWNAALQVAKGAADLAGLDPADVLFGMI